jgi:hypothetical protein
LGWSLWRGRQIPAAEARFVRRHPEFHSGRPLMPVTLIAVTGLLRDYHTNAMSRRDLEGKLADLVMDPGIVLQGPADGPADSSEAVAYRIAEHICGLTGPDQDLTNYVRRVLACLAQIGEPGEALDILPLIWQHHEFSGLIAKHASGLISRAGMQSAFAKRFPSNEHRSWLARATTEQLSALSKLLDTEEYLLVHQLLTTTNPNAA